MNSTEEYDFIAIGLGPFNLGLACLTEPIESLRALFLEVNDGFNWHPGIMLDNTTLQTPFLADLVTLADPTSKFSFLNYLKSQGRIYSFYIKENFFLMRNEYNLYCQWVARRLHNIEFNRFVERITFTNDRYHVHCVCTKTGKKIIRSASKLVLGTGTAPNIPECCKAVNNKISHSSSYLHDKTELKSKKSITIVGSGQSAAEIYYDLLSDIDNNDYQLNWLTRSPRFFPLEYSKLTLEMTSPDYVDYFHQLPATKRDQLLKSQTGLFKGINTTLINAIYDLLYNKNLDGRVNTNLITNVELTQCVFNDVTQRFELQLLQREQQKPYQHQTEALLLATGYSQRIPAFLNEIMPTLNLDGQHRFAVARNYSIDQTGSRIFVQNAELHTHGLAAPDLGMGCYRNSYIIKELTGIEYYPIEQRIAFQQFATPEIKIAPALMPL